MQLHAVAPIALGDVQCAVGVAQQKIVVRVTGVDGVADAGGNRNLIVSANAKRQLADFFTQPFKDSKSFRRASLHQYQQKLLAAVAEDIIAGANIIAEQLRNVLDGPVADHMAPAIIDLFKVVDIDNRHRHRQLILHRQRHFMLEDNRQIAAVQQAGQRILTALHLRQAAKEYSQLAADLLAMDMNPLQQSLRIFILRTVRRGFPGR